MTFDAGAGTAAIRYTSTPDLSGSAELTVTVHDPGPDGQLQPGVQDADDGVTTESFTVVVSSVNDPVTGSDESFTVVREDGAVTLDVLANENSANNDGGENLRVLFVTQPSLGGIEIINGGSHTVSWGADWDFAAGTAPVITVSATDVLSYYVTSANNITVSAIQAVS